MTKKRPTTTSNVSQEIATAVRRALERSGHFSAQQVQEHIDAIVHEIESSNGNGDDDAENEPA